MLSVALKDASVRRSVDCPSSRHLLSTQMQSTYDLMKRWGGFAGRSGQLYKEGSNVPRKGHTRKRRSGRPNFNNKVVTKLINNIMLDGKKGVAQKIVYGAFDRVAETTGKDAMEVFEEAMNNIMPVLEVKAKRIGGATYQVPIEVRPERRQTLALRWITLFPQERREDPEGQTGKRNMDAANNTGASVKKKEDMHKMAEANKAFSHFRF